MGNSDIQQELKAIVDAYQSSLAVFVKDANKIVEINRAKSEDLYTDPKSINYQSLREAGLACLEKVKDISVQCSQNNPMLLDAQVEKILQTVQQEIFSTTNV